MNDSHEQRSPLSQKIEKIIVEKKISIDDQKEINLLAKNSPLLASDRSAMDKLTRLINEGSIAVS